MREERSHYNATIVSNRINYQEMITLLYLPWMRGRLTSFTSFLNSSSEISMNCQYSEKEEEEMMMMKKKKE